MISSSHAEITKDAELKLIHERLGDITATENDTAMIQMLKRVKITNIVATCNLNISNINLKHYAMNHFACTYNKHTFSAMLMHAFNPWCAALIYFIGVMVCMGTKSIAHTILACHKIVHVMNTVMNIKCEIDGIAIDNIVMTTSTGPLDLSACNRHGLNDIVSYNPRNFAGAIVRCDKLSSAVSTGAVIAIFKTGMINITGSRSVEEGQYMLSIAYKKIIRFMEIPKVPMPNSRDSHKRANKEAYNMIDLTNRLNRKDDQGEEEEASDIMRKRRKLFELIAKDELYLDY